MAPLAFALAAMGMLVPRVDHTTLAMSIAGVVESEEPLFRDDADKLRTTSFLVAVAFRESSFRLDAVGDGGRALCAFQLWAAPRAVLSDAVLCTRIAFERLRESIRACGPSNLLGIYAAGPHGCSMPVAKRISRDRQAIAARLLREVQL